MSALELIVLVVCALGSCFFSGIETGMISINRLRLRHFVRRKVPGAEILQHFLQHPEDLLGTTLVGTNIVNTVLSVMAVSMGVRWLGVHGSWIASTVVTLFILVVCEYFPKAWFQSFPVHRCLPFAKLLAFTARVLRPLSVPMMGLARALVRGRPGVSVTAQPVITREELIHLTRESKRGGALSGEEERMITGVMELKTITCEEVMVPKDKIVYVHHDTPAGDVMLFARAKEFNQFPVYDQEKQAFVGVVYIFDILADAQPQGKTATHYMRPPQLVSKRIPVDHVLPRMRVTRQPVVLVTDENMQVVGLVSLDDVLAEFVGI